MSAPSTSGEVSLVVADARATITLRRPEKHNALTGAMWDEITRLVDEAAARPDVRILVIEGAGTVFSAGADLGEVLDATAGDDAARRYCQRVVGALLAVASCPVPTVAVVDGPASGGGVELAVAADHRIGTPRTTMQLPFATLGVVPDEFTLSRLRALVGPSFAQWMVLRGRHIDAGTCHRRGLLEELVAVDEVSDLLDSLTRHAGGISSAAVAAVKTFLREPELARDVDVVAAPMVASFLSGEVALAAGRFLAREARRA